MTGDPSTRRSPAARTVPAIQRGLRRRLAEQDGNALILMPAAVLVALGLVSLAITAAVSWRAQFEAQSVASSLANDAASAVDVGSFYTGADPRPAADLVREVVATRTDVSASNGLALACGLVEITPTAPPAVVIECTYSTPSVLRYPGGPEHVTGTVVGRADLREG
jgi:hypothetical protein